MVGKITQERPFYSEACAVSGSQDSDHKRDEYSLGKGWDWRRAHKLESLGKGLDRVRAQHRLQRERKHIG